MSWKSVLGAGALKHLINDSSVQFGEILENAFLSKYFIALIAYLNILVIVTTAEHLSNFPNSIKI